MGPPYLARGTALGGPCRSTLCPPQPGLGLRALNRPRGRRPRDPGQRGEGCKAPPKSDPRARRKGPKTHGPADPPTRTTQREVEAQGGGTPRPSSTPSLKEEQRLNTTQSGQAWP